MHRIRHALCVVVVLISPSAVLAGPLAGTLPGKLDIGAMGAADYRIPIDLPPGIAGLRPSLSLMYGSNGMDGLLGVGWAVTGLSTITRCPMSRAQDGAPGAINFDSVSSNDRYCLDGQKLLSVADAQGKVGVYGADKTEYRLEVDNFSRIVSRGAQAGGPAYFEVKTKDGLSMEYGRTSDAAVTSAAAGSQIFMWALNRVSDNFQNYYRVSYVNNVGLGNIHTFYPDRIEFTGHNDAQIPPNNLIQFHYDSVRPDPHTLYLGGVPMQMGVRMDYIDVQANGVRTRRYGFSYGVSPSTGRSRLNQILTCTTSDSDCLPPTTFTYQEKDVADLTDKLLSGNGGISGTTETGYRVQGAGDFNGDGRADLLAMKVDASGRGTSNSTGQLWFGRADGGLDKLSVPVSSLICPGSSNAAFLLAASGDFNGDGLSDFYVTPGSQYSQAAGGNNPNDCVWLAKAGGGFTVKALSGSEGFISGDAANYMVQATGDFNGDGLTDIYWFRALNSDSNAQHRQARGVAANPDMVWLSDGDGTFTRKTLSGLQAPVNYQVITSGDFNGDGLTDLYFILTNDFGLTQAYANYPDLVWLSKGDGTFTQKTSPIIYSSFRFGGQGDFNGDGLTDLYFFKANADINSPKDNYKSTGPTALLMSQGDGSFLRYNANTSILDHIVAGVGDFNGDGLTDVYYVDAGDDSKRIGLNKPSSNELLLSDGNGGFVRATLSSSEGITTSIASTSVNFNNYQAQAAADFNGDGLTDIYLMKVDSDLKSTGDANDVIFRGGGNLTAATVAVPDLLSRVVDGVGAELRLTYKSASDASVYTKGSGAVYPDVDVTVGTQVVAQVQSSNGVTASALNSTSYAYKQARVNLHGRGFLDFAERSVRDDQSGISVIRRFRQDFPYTGLMSRNETRLSTGRLLSETDSLYARMGLVAGKPTFPYLDLETRRTYDLNSGVIVSSALTDNDAPDIYGNVGHARVVMYEGQVQSSSSYTRDTVDTYSNDVANWILGRKLTSLTTLSHSQADGGARLQRSGYSYHPSTGALLEEMRLPTSGTTPYLTLNYQYDAYGNRTSESAAGAGIATVVSSTAYDARGQFAISSTNALGHTEQYEYADPNGNRTLLRDANGLVTSWFYDPLGRVAAESRADGSSTITTYQACTSQSPCPFGLAKLKISTVRSGMPSTATYLDVLNREIVRERQGFDGKPIFEETEFDALGRTVKTSRPYRQNATRYFTTFTHDLLGRVVSTTQPGTGTTTTVYDKLTTEMTNARGQKTTEVKNVAGQTVSVKDAAGSFNRYDYDAAGNLVRVTDPNLNVTTYGYDEWDNRITAIDPDLGIWRYTYDVLGRLLTQKNANGQISTYTYDKLGRSLTRTEQEGTTTWTYDAMPRGIGKPASVAMGNLTRRYAYDEAGRLQKVDYITDQGTFSETTRYDALGRISQVGDASGFMVERRYNAVGYLEAIARVGALSARILQPPVLYWKALDQDVDGNVSQQLFGNDIGSTRAYDAATGRLSSIMTGAMGAKQNLAYAYDEIGNLASRKDLRSGASEYFTYDALNRVIGTRLASPGQADRNTQFAYDAIGNLTFKTAIGSYVYGQKPHAVQAAGSNTYTYDANGNLLSGAGRTVTWASFDLPVTILRNGQTEALTYGPGRERFRQTISGTAQDRVTTYLGADYERDTALGDSSRVLEERHYIRAGSIVVAIYTTRQAGGAELTYLYRDNLQSVDVVERTTDTQAYDTDRYSYDTHGTRRNISWQPGVPEAVRTRRGYTGHEHLEEVGLIHMGGRVYDPDLGRFLSADPTMQFPKSTQGLNRYSYALNNPMTFTDPSGFSIVDSIKNWWIGFITAYSFPTFGQTLNPAQTMVANAASVAPVPGVPANASAVGHTEPQMLDSFVAGPGGGGSAPGHMVSSPTHSADTALRPSVLGLEGAWQELGGFNLGSGYRTPASLTSAGVSADISIGLNDWFDVAASAPASGPFSRFASDDATYAFSINRANSLSETIYVSPEGSMVAQREGTRAWRNGNPGNIVKSKFATGSGAIGADGNLAIFPNSSIGGNAMSKLLSGPAYSGLSVNAAIAKYAPAFENDTGAYQKFITTKLQTAGDTALSSLTQHQFSTVKNAIRAFEGWKMGATQQVVRGF